MLDRRNLTIKVYHKRANIYIQTVILFLHIYKINLYEKSCDKVEFGI